MSVELPEDVIRKYGLEVDINVDQTQRVRIMKDIRQKANRLERGLDYSIRRHDELDKSKITDAIKLRLSLALFYYMDESSKNAANQIGGARKYARYLDIGLTAELAGIVAREFMDAAEHYPKQKKQLLREACFNLIFAAEAYCKIKEIDLAREYFGYFLENAPKIKFRVRKGGVTEALKIIAPNLPDEMKAYYKMTREWSKKK